MLVNKMNIKKTPMFKDKSKVQMDVVHHTAITSFDNIKDKIMEKYYSEFSYDTSYVRNAIKSLEKLTGQEVFILFPKYEIMPLIIFSQETAMVIAPIVPGDED